MSNTRIYIVTNAVGMPARLVEASTQAAARNHATRNMVTVKAATAKDVAALLKQGVNLEIAGAEVPDEQSELPGLEEPQQGLGSVPPLPDADVMPSAAVPEHWTASGEPKGDNPLLGEGASAEATEAARPKRNRRAAEAAE